MLLAIAIVSLVIYFLSVLISLIFHESITIPSPKIGLGTVMVMAWWTISLPTAIVLLVFSILWTILILIAAKP